MKLENNWGLEGWGGSDGLLTEDEEVAGPLFLPTRRFELNRMVVVGGGSVQTMSAGGFGIK